MPQNHAQGNLLPPRQARWGTSLLFFLNGVIFATWVTRLPAVQARLMLNTDEIGVALFCMTGGALVAMNFAGYLAARFGSRSVTTIAAVSLCVMFPLLALAPTLPVLMGLLVLFGASHGSMDVAMNAQGVAVEGRYGRPILNSFHACWSLGGLAGAFTAGIAAAHGLAPFSHFLCLTLLFVPLTFLIAPFLLTAQAEIQREKKILARPSRLLLLLGLIAFCMLFGEGAIADWSSIYLASTLHTGTGLAAEGYAVFSLMMALGRGMGDRLTARLRSVMVVRLGGLLAALGLLIVLLAPWVWAVICGFGVVGAGFSAVFPLTLSTAGSKSQQASGTAIATVATCGYLGFLVGPPIIGFAAGALSLRLALGLLIVLSLCAALSAYGLNEANHPHQRQMDLASERPESSIS